MEHHRFFVDATSPDGQVLRLFTDTGGGMNLTTRGADKLGLAYDKDNNLGSEHEPVFGTTPWPAYAGPWIPPPKSADVRDRTSVVEGKSVSVRLVLGGHRIMKKK